MAIDLRYAQASRASSNVRIVQLRACAADASRMRIRSIPALALANRGV